MNSNSRVRCAQFGKNSADMSSSDVYNRPFYPPPPGVVPNLYNPQTRGRDLTITCSIFLGIMISFVSIRAYTKLWIVRKVTWDDRMSPCAINSIQQQANHRGSDVSYRICMNKLERAFSILANHRPSIAPHRDLLCPLRKRYVKREFSPGSDFPFDAYLDVLNGYVGYHSWDVTLGQVAASDFYMVSTVFVHYSNGNTDMRESSLTCSNWYAHWL